MTNYPLKLKDGLILRRAACDDVERLAACNERVKLFFGRPDREDVMARTNVLKIALAAAMLFIAAGTVFAGPNKKFSSKRFGYSLAYPAEWYFREHEELVDVCSAEDAFDAEGGGAGVSVLVQELAAEDEGRADKALARIAGENGEDFAFGEASSRGIGGREWHAVAYSDAGHGLEGELYALVKGAAVYVIGSFYRLPGSRARFQPAVDGLLDSFRFTPVAYREFRDKERGISFRYPEGAEVKDGGDEIAVPLAGKNFESNGFGAGISLGVFSAGAGDAGNMDEKGIFEFLKSSNAENRIVEEPRTVTVSQTAWQRGVMTMQGGAVTIFLKKSGTRFFGIVFIVRPPEAAGEYQPVFDAFLKSLKIDFKKWAAGLERKE